MTAVIIDYGMGNVASVQKALNFLKVDNVISHCKEDIEKADYIILPGVGSFEQGMKNLEKNGLIDALNDQVIVKKKPFLGICLGMQLIATNGNEPVPTKGLGWVEGDIIPIEEPDKRVPHLGWNTLHSTECDLLKEVAEKDFYFIHSYHFKVKESSSVAAVVNYGKDYVAAIKKDNIFATQFHPEKSQDSGLELLKKFFEYYAKN